MQDRKTSPALLVRDLRTPRAISAVPLTQKALRTLTALCMLLTVALGMVTRPASASAAGTTYYVAKSGSDTSGNGSAASPWATIQKAIGSVSGGDTVHVGPGTYAGGLDIGYAKSGTASAPTRFIADGDVIVSGGTNGVILGGNYLVLQGFKITGFTNDGVYLYGSVDHDQVIGCTVYAGGTDANSQAGIHSNGSSYCTLQGNTIHDVTGAGIHGYAAKGMTISGNTVFSCAEDGILISGVDNVVDGNTVRDLSPVNHGDGIVVEDGYYADSDNNIIRNNTLSDCSQNLYVDAITKNILNTAIYDNLIYYHQFSYGSEAEQGISVDAETGSISGLTIESNTIVDMAVTGGMALSYGARTGETCTGVVVKNNIFVNGLHRKNTNSSAVVDDNLYYSPSGGQIVYWNGATYTQSQLAAFASTTGQEAHGIAQNPQLVGSGDFRLQATSPAIGKADPAYSPATDITGAVRDATPDIGAYEYAGAADPTPTPAPTPTPVDVTAPVVALGAPLDGATVSGVVGLAATASDDTGVAKVEFLVDGTLLASDAAAPYAATWDASTASAGSHTIVATAYDAAGNSSASSVSVTVPAPVDAAPPAPVPVATSLFLTPSATRIAVGGSVVLRGRLTAGGVAVTGRSDVAVWKKTGNAGWTFDTMATYDPITGCYEATRVQSRQTSYQFRFAGATTATSLLGASQSNTVTVRVSTSVRLAAVSTASIQKGGSVGLAANVAGPTASSVRVYAYRLAGGRFGYVSSYVMVPATAAGPTRTYRAKVKLERRGTWRFVVGVRDENGFTRSPASSRLRVR